jgi:hypothetical protein
MLLTHCMYFTLTNIRYHRQSDRFISETLEPLKPWTPPFDGTLELQLAFQRLPQQGQHTTHAQTQGMLTLLSTLGDGAAAVIGQALANGVHDAAQGQAMYVAVLSGNGGNKVRIVYANCYYLQLYLTAYPVAGIDVSCSLV